MNDQNIEPLAVPVAKGHLLVGGSQSSFYKTWIGEGWIKPVDLGGRGQSVIIEEVRAAMRKRAEAIRSAKLFRRFVRRAASARRTQPNQDWGLIAGEKAGPATNGNRPQIYDMHILLVFRRALKSALVGAGMRGLLPRWLVQGLLEMLGLRNE